MEDFTTANFLLEIYVKNAQLRLLFTITLKIIFFFIVEVIGETKKIIHVSSYHLRTRVILTTVDRPVFFS